MSSLDERDTFNIASTIMVALARRQVAYTTTIALAPSNIHDITSLTLVAIINAYKLKKAV